VEYRVLVSAILKLSGGRLGVKVDYVGVGQLVGDRNKIKQLNIGFVSYKQLVKGACAEGHAEQGKLGQRKWILLREAVSSLLPNVLSHYAKHKDDLFLRACLLSMINY
jgi:hypothetical protein